MATQTERRQATRAQLVLAAEQLFVSRGYEGTSTADIQQAAGLSRGALYHHFPTKQDLFEAVFEKVSRAAIERALSATSRAGTAFERLEGGCLAWLAEAKRPDVATVLLDQGPAVLGWRRTRELENRSSLGVMTAAVRATAEEGELRELSVEVVAAALNAVLAEFALLQADGSAIPEGAIEETLHRILAVLKPR